MYNKYIMSHISTFEETSHLYCPLTFKIFKDPVSVESGVIYERSAIKAWLQAYNTCPVTNKIICTNVDKIDTNIIIKNLVKKYLIENPEKNTIDNSKENITNYFDTTYNTLTTMTMDQMFDILLIIWTLKYIIIIVFLLIISLFQYTLSLL